MTSRILISAALWASFTALLPAQQVSRDSRHDSGPRIAIESLPGSADALHLIDRPGVYFLSANLTGEASKHGIRVQAHRVTIDLSGFRMLGVPGSKSAIVHEDGCRGLVVRDGTLRGWGERGIDSLGADPEVRGSRFELLRVLDNQRDGISAGAGSQVERCVFARNERALVARESGVDACIAADNDAGFWLQGSGRIRRCLARDSYDGYGIGFWLTDGNGVLEKSVCVGGSIVVSAPNGGDKGLATVRRCVSADYLSYGGISAFAGAHLVENVAHKHSGYGISAGNASILVERNLITQCGPGGIAIGNGAVAFSNASTGNGGGDNYEFYGAFVAGSYIAPGVIDADSKYGHPLF